MNTNLFSSIAIVGVMLIGATACTGVSDKNYSNSNNPDINSVPYAFDIKSAKKCYEISNSNDTMKYTLAIEATVTWPVKMGDFDIKPLQDTIASIIAGKQMHNINDAIISYFINTAVYELGDKITEVDSVPTESPFNTAFYVQTDVTFPEISTDLVTMCCVTDQYLGGAHNMTGSFILSYDLNTGIFITNKWLFIDPNAPAIQAAIKSAIEEETNMTSAELEQTMLVPEIPIPDDVYLQNGMIVFHYNPYAILPYSFGTIDASVSPYIIKDLLTPDAHKLLISE